MGAVEGSLGIPTEFLPATRPQRLVWNKGRIVGQKRPLQPKHVWSIQMRLEMADTPRDLALFDHRQPPLSADCAEPAEVGVRRVGTEPHLVGRHYLHRDG